jgi:hypothetical protein
MGTIADLLRLALLTLAVLAFPSCWNGSGSGDAGADSGPDADSDSDGGTETTCPVHVVGEGGSDSSSGNTWAEGLATVERGLDLAELVGCDVWVKAGTYHPTHDPDGAGAPEDPRTVTFRLRADVAIYGGFAGNETFLEQRDLEANEATLSGDIGTTGDGSDNTYHVVTGTDDATIDGFTITASSDSGMINDSSSPTVVNCTFSGNTAEAGGGMLNMGSSPTVANCVFSGNSAEYGGGMENYNSSPTVTHCTFSGNTAGSGGGGMMNDGSSSPNVTGCIFLLNSSLGEGYEYGGGGMSNYGSSPTVTNCTFSGNSARSGGGMKNDDSPAAVKNCLFIGNFAEFDGGGMYNAISSPTVTNCTFSGNFAAPGCGGGILNDASLPVVTNCIFGDDTETEIDNWGMGFTPTVTYSDVQGGCTVASGCTTDETGNIDVDPLFVDGVSGDLRLQAGSPCIDTGSNDAVPDGVTTDLDGNPRIADGDGDDLATIDMGAYEYQP